MLSRRQPDHVSESFLILMLDLHDRLHRHGLPIVLPRRMDPERVRVRENVHVQMADGVIGEDMKPADEIACLQLLERRLGGFKESEDVVTDRFVGGRTTTVCGAEFFVLVLEGAFGAGEHLGLAHAVGGVPEGDEVGSHLADEVAVVCSGGRVDDVVDAVLGDDEAVSEGLALGTLAGDGGGVLAAVVGGDIADDVGAAGLAEDEVGGVVIGIFLCGGWLGFLARFMGWGVDVRRRMYR